MASELGSLRTSVEADGFQPVVMLEATPAGSVNSLNGSVTVPKRTHRPTTTAMSTTTTASTTTKPPVTTTVATTTTTTAPPVSMTKQVFDLVNDAREQAGCTALTEDPRLDTAAQGHSDDMSKNDYFAHTTPSGESFAQRETAAGYPNPGGENIAQGYTNAQAVMTAWMNSPDHKANILNCQFNAIGIGVDTTGWYWTQDFGY